jgi:hypothetical protein
MSNTKKPLFHPSERVDLEDFQNAVAEHPRNLQADLIRSFMGSGVLDGFRVEVLSQTGSTIGHVNIYNGIGADWAGGFVNAISGTNSQRLVLGSSNTEYWIEIEVLFTNSDPDNRAFYDPLTDNTAPYADGQEINVSGVHTRQTPLWRVKQPIRNNTAGARDGSGYAPARFSANDSLVIPIAVIRTDAGGRILSGDPNTDATGNDLVTETYEGGATKTFLKMNGYGHASVSGKVQGLKTSDQRPRLFSRVEPPFLGGSNGSLIGDSESDAWARDVKSMFDHLATQIAQMKKGASDSSIGDYYSGILDSFDSDYNYIDISDLTLGVTGSQTVDPDDLMGTTFQITEGPWAGFYAEVAGNAATSSDVTRVYLKKSSTIPDWKPLPDTGVYVRIVKHRQVNWCAKPTPNSSYRGYDALDDEVVESRVDYYSQQTFDNIRARANAGKYATVSFAPVDTKNSATGEPTSSTTPRADYFESISDIRTAFTSATSSRGGIVKFRRGTYDFSSLTYGTVVFSASGKDGFVIEGDSAETTVLNYATGSGGNHLIFALTSCKDVVFRNMTLQGEGKLLSLSGCENIKFENCKIISDFVDLTTESADFGSADKFKFENCHFSVSGAGLSFSSFSDSVMDNCVVQGPISGSALSAGTDLSYLIQLGSVSRSRFHNNRWRGYASTSVIAATQMTKSFIYDNIIEGYSLSAGASGRLHVSGTVDSCDIHNNVFSSDGITVGAETLFTFKCGSFSESSFDNNRISNSVSGVVTANMTKSSVNGNNFQLLAEGTGVSTGPLVDSRIIGNDFKIEGSTPGTGGIGIEYTTNLRSSIYNNSITAVSGSLWKGITQSGTTCSSAKICDNVILSTVIGIEFDGIEGARKLKVTGNEVQSVSSGTLTARGISVTFQTSNARYINISNNIIDASGYDGFYLFLDGCNVTDSHFDGNIIRDEGSLSHAMHLNTGNYVDNFDRCSFSHNAMTSAWLIDARCEYSNFNANRIDTSSETALFLRNYMIHCVFSDNILNTSNDHAVRFSYLQGCKIQGNDIKTTGNTSCGFFWETYSVGLLQDNTITNNKLLNTTKPSLPGVTPWTGGTDDWSSFNMGFMFADDQDLTSFSGSNEISRFNDIRDNTTDGFHIGFFMPGGTSNHVSGNRILVPAKPSSVNIGFVLADKYAYSSATAAKTALYCIGGHIEGSLASLPIGTPGAGSTDITCPGWIGDKTTDASTSSFANTLWPYNTEKTRP